MIDKLSALRAGFRARLPRLAGWMIVALALTLCVGLTQPALLLVSVYKLSLGVTAGVVGYFLDRGIFPYARPETFTAAVGDDDFTILDGRAFAAAMLRRALLVAALVVGVCLGA